jgi:hypothetical protein
MAVKIGIVPYSFGTKDYQRVKDQLLKRGPINPVAELSFFNSITEARGYNFFSQESIEDWKLKYGSVGNETIRSLAESDLALFLAAVRTPSASDHEANRLMFKGAFDSSEQKARLYFIKEAEAKYGRDNPPFQNKSHEARILNFARIETKHAGFELSTFMDIIKSKWAAIGYLEDAIFRQRFLDDYCIALK